MATERLIIEVSTKGTRIVRRDIKGIGQAAKGSQRDVLGLGRALTLLGGLALARSILKTADSFQQLQNRLRIVTEGTEELNAVTQELFILSNQTRSAVQANAELFTRLSLATRELGLTQRELLDITKSMNQAIIISGASAQEANAGLIQLSQGLASGVLRGDELRSVLEQLPAVADVIARQLGVTRGALRELGSQGKITAEVITKAFANNREILEELFARTVPTLAQSFTILGNAIVKLVSEVEGTGGPLAALGRAVIFLAENIEVFARVILGVVLARALSAAVAGFRALTIAILANPIGILIAALGLAITQLVVFADKIKIGGDELTTLADFAAEFGEVLGAAFSEIADGAKEFLATLGPIGKELSKVDLSFETVVRAVAGGLDLLVKRIGTMATVIGVFFQRLPGLIGDAFFQGVNAAVRAINFLIRKTQIALNLLLEQAEKAVAAISGQDPPDLGRVTLPSIPEVDNRFKGEIEDFGNIVGELFRGAITTNLDEGLSGVIDGIFERARQRARDRAAELAGAAPDVDLAAPRGGAREEVRAQIIEQSTAVTKLNQTLETERKLVEELGIERKSLAVVLKLEQVLRKKAITLTKDEIALFRERAREIEVLKQRNQVLQELRSVETERLERTEALNVLRAEGLITEQEFNRELEQLRANVEEATTVLGGMANVFKEISLDVDALGRGLGGPLLNSLNSASSAIADFALSGFQDITSLRQAFSQLFGQLAKDILAFTIRLLILKAIQQSIQGFGGGVAAGATGGPGAQTQAQVFSAFEAPFPGQQAGGPVQRGRPVVVGERGTELFVPPANGNIVPAGQFGAQPDVNITIVNVDDPNAVVAAVESAEGQQAILNVIQRNRTELRNVLA